MENRSLQDKRCQNCKRTRAPTAFYTSKKTNDGLSAICRACWSIKNLKKPPTVEVANAITQFDKTTEKISHRTLSLLKGFEAEFLSGHWEASAIYLGRMCEAHTFQFSAHIGVSNEFPNIEYLRHLSQTLGNLRERIREILVDPEVFLKQKKEIRGHIQQHIERTVKFGYELDDLLEQYSDAKGEIDILFALKGIKKFYFLTGNSEKKNLVGQYDKRYREIMKFRNIAAHAPREKSISIWKKNVTKSRSELIELINISSELLSGNDFHTV